MATSSGTITTFGDRLLGAGYLEREARFLSLVLAHSGVFIMRQFYEYARAGGSQSEAFIKRLLKRRDVRRFNVNRRYVMELTENLHHLAGEEFSRRPLKRPAVLRQRLMSLDYAAAHQDDRYLTGEAEKLFYFGNVRKEFLPSRLNALTGRTLYFPEQFPIIATTAGASFVYPSGASVSQYLAFLRRYRAVMTSLPTAELVFLTSSSHLGSVAKVKAHREFKRWGREDPATVNAEFQERLMLEELPMASQDDLNRLRWLATSKYSHIYSAWKADPESLRGVIGVIGSVRFRVELVRERYLFLYDSTGRDAEDAPDASDRDICSGSSSVTP